MKRERGWDQMQRDRTSVVTVGTFDGVHRGHQAILDYLRRRAAKADGTSVVVTFDPHPREVVRGEPVPLLTTIGERAELLERFGIDRYVVIPFTQAFSQLSAEDFVRDVLLKRIGLQEIVVGYDHGFGRGRKGDHAMLQALGEAEGFRVDIIPAQLSEDQVISSTEVRRLLQAGDVREAAVLLGRPYAVQGLVIEGDRRGRTIGFPTANLRLSDARKVLPAYGVYAVRVGVPGRAEAVAGMMNIGMRPTFDGAEERLEVHLLDFDGHLYDLELWVDFVERLREERRFDSVDALVRQLSEDRRRCRAALAEHRSV